MVSNGRRVAVLGATGYIGTRLVPRLAEAGHFVRCIARSPRKLRDREWRINSAIEVVPGDLSDGPALAALLKDIDVVYYLVHAMHAGSDFADADRAMAATVAGAARDAAVERIIYLGGLGDPHDQLSPHLASRREVEEVLRSTGVPVTVLRAAMIIGSGSASFEILRYLTERLPVMITPRWVSTECQPIAVRDVLRYLIDCLADPETSGRVLEIGGADRATYRELIQMVAAERGLRPRAILPVPVLTPWLSSLWIHLVTPVGASLARPLAEGLRNRVVVTDQAARELMPHQVMTAREAIRAALDAEARFDVESSWSAAGPVPGDPDWAGGDVFEDARTAIIPASPDRVFEVVTRLGGRQGWFRYNRLWRLRGFLDRLAGGPGTARGRRHPDSLHWGDTLDFWRVVELERGRRLTLRAEMLVPGDAVLDFELQPAEGGQSGTRLIQTARFRPRGIAGLLYWYAVAPFHKPVFDGLLDGIRSAATSS